MSPATMEGMCRKGGRRCDAKWGEASRERYNARRRVTRNSEKAQSSRDAGNEEKASYYDGLVDSARAVDAELTAAINAHEGTTPEPVSPAPEVDPDDYRIAHSAPSNNGYNKPLDNPVGIYPDDYADHPDWYGAEHEETIRQVRAAQGDPDHVVTVYRGVPRGVTRISRGDWVSLSRDYAEQESMGAAADSSTSSDDRGRGKCGSCGQWASPDHTCPQQATKDQLRETSTDWRDSFTPEESQALESFSSIDHADINRKLREGRGLTADEEATVQGLDSLTSRAPRTEETHTLYRGIGFAEGARGEPSGKDWVAAHCREGQQVDFAGFTSTTTTRETAEYFSGARSEHVTSGVIFEVETTQAGYTKDSAEDEVLLGRGSRFEVISSGEEVEVEGKPYQQVRLREVEPATSASSPGWDQGAQHSPKEAKDFGAHLESKHGVTMHLSGKSDPDSYVTLHHIEVPEGQRGSGAGKAAMRDLVEEADRNGWKLDLTPAGDYGGNVPRLKRFYKGFGFVENKGRNKDYATRETFLRLPQ